MVRHIIRLLLLLLLHTPGDGRACCTTAPLVCSASVQKAVLLLLLRLLVLLLITCEEVNVCFTEPCSALASSCSRFEAQGCAAEAAPGTYSQQAHGQVAVMPSTAVQHMCCDNK